MVAGQWTFLYRTVDKLGHTVDFLLTAKRDVLAARRFFERAIGLHDLPKCITIEKSRANTAAVLRLVADGDLPIELRQSKHLNNILARAYSRWRPEPVTSVRRGQRSRIGHTAAAPIA